MNWCPRYLVVLCLFPLAGFSESAMEAQLKKYEGRWVGEFTVHSAVTDYTETFPVEQQYWWKDEELRGVAVSQRESGMHSSRSRTYIEDGRFVSKVKQSSEEEEFIGMLHEGGIVWVSAEPGRAEDYQMREVIKEEGGKRVLKTDGFDTYTYEDEPAHLVYRGKLVFDE